MDLSVCRLCSKSENKLINIFNDTSDDVFLAKKILLCFGVHIREEDSITKNICKSCYFFTSTAYEHRVTSLANNAKLWKENRNRHPDTNFKLPEIRPLPKTVSYLPKDISQDDFLQVLNLSHSTKHAQNQNTSPIHESIKKIKIKYPTLKLGDAYQHYNFDPVVVLDRSDCYYNYKQVEKPNLDIWSVNNDLKNETSILLKRIKRIPKPINRDYSKSAVQVLKNNARKKVVGNKIKQGSDNSSVTSTSTLDISLEVQRGVKRSRKEYKNKKSCRFHHIKGGKNKKKKGFRTKTSTTSLVTRGAVKAQDLKRKDGHADLKSIELEVKRRKLVVELPKVDKSELSHIYQEALKHSVNQLDETEEQISSDISDHNDDLLMSFGTSQEAFICQTCNKIFDTLLLLKIHKRNSHKSSSLRCSHCSKRFTLVETLMKHLEMHSQKKPITGPNDALLHATNSKYTLRSVAKKSTGGVLDFLRSNTFSDSNLVLAVENGEPSMVNESDIEQTKDIESNSEVKNSNTGETGTTEIVPAMRIVARKSTGGISSSIRISTSSDDNSDTEGNANLTNIKIEQLDFAPPMKITARGSTEEGNSRFSVETLLLTDENIKSPNSDPLEIVPAVKIVARKSTGGEQKFHINEATLYPFELLISSDEEDENVDVLGNVDINPNIANNQPVNKNLPWNTNESFTSNVNVFDLALQPQLPDIEEQQSVENTEKILANENGKLVENSHSVQEIYDSDAEDVVFIPNKSLSVNDSALNGESTSTVTTGTSTLSAARTSNQAPLSQCSAKKDKEQQNTKTDTRNKKIINETDFVNYIFNKCNYNSNTKAITNQQWILNGIKTIIDQGPVPIIVEHSSDGRLDILYKHSPKPDKTQPIIDVPWKDIAAIDFPLRPVFKSPKNVKIAGKDPNLNQNTIATSQQNQFKQTSAVQSPSDTTEFHKHVICDKSQSSTSNSGSATKQIYIRLKKTNTISKNSPPNGNEPNSDPNIMRHPNSSVKQYPSKLGIPTSSGSNNTKTTHVPTSAPPTTTKTATPPTSSQNFRSRAILYNTLPTFSSIPTVGTDVMSKATPTQQTSSKIVTRSETDVPQSNGDKSNQKKSLSLSAEIHARLLSQMNKNNKKSLNPDPSPISTTSATANPTNSNQQQSGQVAYISEPNVTQTYGNKKIVQSPNILPTSIANTTRVMPANSNQQMGSVTKIPDTSQVSTYHLPGSATLTSVNIQSNPKQQIAGSVVNQNRSYPNAMYGKQRMVNSSSAIANGRKINILRYAGAKPIAETGTPQVSTNSLPVTIPTREGVSAPSQSNMNQTNRFNFTSSYLQVPTRMNLTRPALTTNYNQHNSGQLRNLNVLNTMQTYGVRHIAGVRHILTNSTNPSHLLMPRNPNQDNSGLATNPNMSKPVQVYSNQSRVANNFLPPQLLLPANMNQQMAHISESIIQSNTNQQVSTAQNTSQIVLLSQYHQQSVGLLTVRELQATEVASMAQNKNPPLSTPSVTNIPTTDVSRIDAQTSASSDLDPEKKPAIRIKSLTEINNANPDKSRDQLHSTYVQTLTKYVTDNPNTVNETCNSNINEYLQIS